MLLIILTALLLVLYLSVIVVEASKKDRLHVMWVPFLLLDGISLTSLRDGSKQ